VCLFTTESSLTAFIFQSNLLAPSRALSIQCVYLWLKALLQRSYFRATYWPYLKMCPVSCNMRCSNSDFLLVVLRLRRSQGYSWMALHWRGHVWGATEIYFLRDGVHKELQFFTASHCSKIVHTFYFITQLHYTLLTNTFSSLLAHNKNSCMMLSTVNTHKAHYWTCLEVYKLCILTLQWKQFYRSDHNWKQRNVCKVGVH
jgi:hypothetical protein